MKKLNFASLAILFCLFITPFLVNGKGAEVEKVIVSIELRLDNGGIFVLNGNGTIVKTPNSNFLKTYKFDVPEDVLNQIDFGIFANKIIGILVKINSDEVLEGDGFLNKSGLLTVTVHRNGSGGFFPKGWF